MRKVNQIKTILLLILSFLGAISSCKRASTTENPGRDVSPKARKVLFIGIDGLVWKTLTTADAPILKALMDSSWTSTNALAEIPTWSANGWAALLTGTGVAKHRANENSFTNADFGTYPSFFHVIKSALPTARTGSIVTWAPINDKIIATDDISFKIKGADDNQTEASLINELSTNNPDVLFSHFDDVDHAGHAYNFKPETPEYIAAVTLTDKRVERIIKALKSRANYKNEDWLIVVATDHGGDNSHGGSSYKEQNAFIILNNKTISPKLVAGEPEITIETKPNTINTLNFQKDVYAELPALSGLDLSANGSFTLEFRVRATAMNSDPVIIGNKNWANGRNKGIIISNNGGTIRANFGDGSTNRLDVDGVDLSDQNWHHVAVVVDRTLQKVTMYDGGLPVAQGDISKVGDLQSGTAFKIAQDGTGVYTPNFTGNIAGIRIFKTAVAASVLSNYAFIDLNDHHPNKSDLLIYAKGNDGAGAVYAGSFGLPALMIKTNNGFAATWGSIAAPVFVKKTTDLKGASHLYSVAPTILKFLGIAIPAAYDGKSLINF